MIGKSVDRLCLIFPRATSKLKMFLMFFGWLAFCRGSKFFRS